jgi:hypothetical protein
MHPFFEMMTDRVTLVKQNGDRFPNLPAAVTSKGTILTSDPKLPIEDDDEFERALPSGVVERFIVLDAGFYPEYGGMPAGYSSSVMKSSTTAPISPQPLVEHFNLIGANARVNFHSSDSSTNVVSAETRANLLSTEAGIASSDHGVNSQSMTAAKERSWITLNTLDVEEARAPCAAERPRTSWMPISTSLRIGSAPPDARCGPSD